jgi:hypothetical protein
MGLIVDKKYIGEFNEEASIESEEPPSTLSNFKRNCNSLRIIRVASFWHGEFLSWGQKFSKFGGVLFINGRKLPY